jgi:hypothetical protein
MSQIFPKGDAGTDSDRVREYKKLNTSRLLAVSAYSNPPSIIHTISQIKNIFELLQ